jgi:hydroxymethylpyrimidine pyrophosphatase-like HAD family hydrolase
VRVTLCTGRMYSGTRQIAERLSLTEPVACIDGSHIVDVKTHQELASVPLPAVGVMKLLDILKEDEPIAFVFSGDRVYFDGNGAGHLPYVTTWSEQTVKVANVLDTAHWHDANPIAALVALGSEALITAASLAIETHGEVLQCATFPLKRYEGIWGMVVRAARVDKGTAVEWLAAHHGITPEEMVAVGDWLNDIPMLRRAGRTFAMGQAPDEVKAAATDVLEADVWSGGGIAEAAERAGLL